MKTTTGLLVLTALIAFSASASAQDREAYCKLAYAYNPDDGVLTCVVGDQFYSFYPHESARTNRRLPRGIELKVIYVPMRGYGSGSWKRIYFWRRQSAYTTPLAERRRRYNNQAERRSW